MYIFKNWWWLVYICVTCFQNETPFQAHPLVGVEVSTVSVDQSRLDGQNVYLSNQTNESVAQNTEPSPITLAGDDDDLVFPRSR